MAKKFNKYQLQLTELELKNQESTNQTLTFDFENHDDIFNILERTKNTQGFSNPNDEIEFFVGLKLFSEVMLRNKKNPLFEEFFPAFVELMKKIKENTANKQ
ncbi:DUF3861 domain-containing protein [Flavobacterium agricola]|uniref:DUF3861 domain-containing protein n=1 Tax=Flavobacterium agricola TaxID=2870839 RepID=A0ABY6LYM7_9FLAO|nr:DUF3861 domain-containing protein [Flavobacterium agricola]UYW01428.1 DUF3861 domain-containing protein [Flavobacterium agricola]